MKDYDISTYGDRFADVYDEWYGDGAQPYSSPTTVTINCLVDLANSGAVLELGVGTGRIALGLVGRVAGIHGIDSSPLMLAQLATKPLAEGIHVTVGDMVNDMPDGPFDLIVVAANTLFNLDSAERQGSAFLAASHRLRSGGRLVVEAFVPTPRQVGQDEVSVRTLDADTVVLSVSRTNSESQVSEQQLIEFTSAGIRLRPTRLRWSTPEELDVMAIAAGLVIEYRWADWNRTAFLASSAHHVTVWTKR